MKNIISIIFVCLSISCYSQAKNDSVISIPPTLESRMVDAEKSIASAKAEIAKAEKELQDGIKILFEIVGKKPEEYDVVGYAAGMIKIKKRQPPVVKTAAEEIKGKPKP